MFCVMGAQGLSVYRLPSPGLADRGVSLSGNKAAADHLVSSDLPD